MNKEDIKKVSKGKDGKDNIYNNIEKYIESNIENLKSMQANNAKYLIPLFNDGSLIDTFNEILYTDNDKITYVKEQSIRTYDCVFIYIKAMKIINIINFYLLILL